MTEKTILKRCEVFRGPIGFTPAESIIAVGLILIVLVASTVVVYQRLVRPSPQFSLETHLVPTAETPAAVGPAESLSSAIERESNPPVSVDRGLLNLNTADYADLVRLPGIGPVLAGRIMEYRDRCGPFPAVDSLINVAGIGPAKLEKIRPAVRIR